jgi:hypothetical protein
MDKRNSMVKIAVFGAGYWRKNLIRNFAKLGVFDNIRDSNIHALKSIEESYKTIQTTQGSLLYLTTRLFEW